MLAIVSERRQPGTAVALDAATTLGRAAVRTLVVDVDAVGPSLHTVAGVDRRPTLAALRRGRSPIHPHPEVPAVGIVPAPLESERIAVEPALRRLDESGATVLVDCPLGAGPVVADVLRAADRALVVAADRGSDRSPAPVRASSSSGAKTDDPTARTDDPTARTDDPAARTDDPAAVPEGARLAKVLDVGEVHVVSVDRGGSATGVGLATRRAVELARRPGDQALQVRNRTARSGDRTRSKAKSYGTAAAISRERMVGRLETGIDVLDRKLDGGLPPGCVVAYTASPASQSELLLYELTAARGTLYLTTERTDDVVRHSIESSMARVGSPTIRHVASNDPLEESHRLVSALPDGANLIVDTMDVVERTDLDAYRAFLNDLKTQMLETGSIAVMHCLKGDEIPENRTTTLHMADAVFDLQTNRAATEVENYLTIPKFRGGGAPTERIKLELAEQVAIDTSRDIA